MERSIPFTAYHPTTGEVVFSGTADNPEVFQTEDLHIQRGVVYPPLGWLEADGSYTPRVSPPSRHHVFNYTTKLWADPRTLQDHKVARNTYVNAARLAANQTYFIHQGKQIAVDGLSRSDIDGVNGEVLNTGGFPVGWPGAWKCLDNTWLPITTVGEWKAFYSSMVAQGTTNFGVAQALKSQIEAAVSPEEVASVTWP